MKALALLLMMLLPMASWGQNAVALLGGESAPHNGILLKEDRLKSLLDSEILAKDLQGRLDIQMRLNSSVENVYIDQINKLTDCPWYESIEFNRWLGFGIGVIVTGFAFYAVLEFRQMAIER